MRTVTSVLFVVVLVGCVTYPNPIVFASLFAIISSMTTWEFCTIVNTGMGTKTNKFVCAVASAYLFLAIFTYNLNITGSGIFMPYLLTIIYLFISELYIDRNNTLLNWAFMMMSQMYIALPFASMNALALISVPDRFRGMEVVYSPELILGVFFFIWCSDAGAYCVGSLIGKHKLFPRISPAKSWEGSIGGGIVSILVSMVMAFLFPIFSEDNNVINSLCWAGLSVVVTFFGTWGDLVESLIKRKLSIKDSGNILPGHGGMLDRFDSSLMAFPAAVIYVYMITQM